MNLLQMDQDFRTEIYIFLDNFAVLLGNFKGPVQPLPRGGRPGGLARWRAGGPGLGPGGRLGGPAGEGPIVINYSDFCPEIL